MVNNKNIKHKKNRGQIAGQVFIYMLAVIIIGGIALVGYKAIDAITTRVCQAEKATFNNDIESLIEGAISYGSVNKKSIKAPCGEYDTICFVATSEILSAPSTGTFSCSESQIIKDSVDNRIEQNIFVLSNKRTIPIGYSDIVSLNTTYDSKCLCIKQHNGKFDILFSGKGSSVEIREG
ncbi:MAG: hypothetical protein ACP5N1_01615 [Candidatus Woesearchaeota archaeon]